MGYYNNFIRITVVDYVVDKGNYKVEDKDVDVIINLNRVSSIVIHPIEQHDIGLSNRFQSEYSYINMDNGQRYKITDDKLSKLAELIELLYYTQT